MVSSCTYYVTKWGSTSLYDQNCGVQLADRQSESQTEIQTQSRTDKSLKTEETKILSNYIFYFKTVIIGPPIMRFNKNKKLDWIYIGQLVAQTGVDNKTPRVGKFFTLQLSLCV